MKKLMTLILMLLIVTALFAEEKEPAYIEFDESLGFQYGMISGTGLTYQTWITEDISLMGTFGALYNPTTSGYYGDILNYIIGGEAHFRVYGDDYANWFSAQLYVFTGINHAGNIESVTITEPDYLNGIEGVYGPGAYQYGFTLGVGIGIELILFRHISIPFEIGYGIGWSPTAGDQLADQFSIDLMPQVGFKYRY